MKQALLRGTSRRSRRSSTAPGKPSSAPGADLEFRRRTRVRSGMKNGGRRQGVGAGRRVSDVHDRSGAALPFIAALNERRQGEPGPVHGSARAWRPPLSSAAFGSLARRMPPYPPIRQACILVAEKARAWRSHRSVPAASRHRERDDLPDSSSTSWRGRASTISCCWPASRHCRAALPRRPPAGAPARLRRAGAARDRRRLLTARDLLAPRFLLLNGDSIFDTNCAAWRPGRAATRCLLACAGARCLALRRGRSCGERILRFREKDPDRTGRR